MIYEKSSAAYFGTENWIWKCFNMICKMQVRLLSYYSRNLVIFTMLEIDIRYCTFNFQKLDRVTVVDAGWSTQQIIQAYWRLSNMYLSDKIIIIRYVWWNENTWMFMPLGFIAPKTFNYIGFPIFWFWAYQMKVIPETRRVH